MLSMCFCILIQRDISWSCILRKISRQCHSNPGLLSPHKPPDPVMYHDDIQTFGLKIRVDIWTRIDVVPAEYGIFAHNLHFTM